MPSELHIDNSKKPAEIRLAALNTLSSGDDFILLTLSGTPGERPEIMVQTNLFPDDFTELLEQTARMAHHYRAGMNN